MVYQKKIYSEVKMEHLEKLEAELQETKVKWAQVLGGSPEYYELKDKIDFLVQKIEFVKLADSAK